MPTPAPTQPPTPPTYAPQPMYQPPPPTPAYQPPSTSPPRPTYQSPPAPLPMQYTQPTASPTTAPYSGSPYPMMPMKISLKMPRQMYSPNQMTFEPQQMVQQSPPPTSEDPEDAPPRSNNDGDYGPESVEMVDEGGSPIDTGGGEQDTDPQTTLGNESESYGYRLPQLSSMQQFVSVLPSGLELSMNGKPIAGTMTFSDFLRGQQNFRPQNYEARLNMFAKRMLLNGSSSIRRIDL